jgi:hypothetical protein
MGLMIATPAFAQSGAPTTIAIQAAVQAAVNMAKQASDYAGLTPAQKALRLAAAVQAAVALELNSGAQASDVSAALANLVNAGFVSLSIAAQGAAQAAAQVAAAGGGSPGAQSQALALVTGLQSGTGPLGTEVASAGGLNAAVTATNAQGQTITVVTSLGTVLAAAATGQLGNITVNDSGAVVVGGQTQSGPNNNGYTPCTNVVADYC